MILRLRSLLLPALLACTCLAAAAPVAAHPMGNFSINHYTSISVGPRQVRVLYIVDMAEIPTFQELNSLGVGENVALGSPRRAAYLRREAGVLGAGLRVSFAGRRVPLRVRAADLLFPPGAGGLLTERLYLALDGRLPHRSGTLVYRDENFAGRAGWKEIAWGATSGVVVDRASVPGTDRSRFLSVYPAGVINSPPQDLTARLDLRPRRVNVDGERMRSALAAIRQAEAPLLHPGGGWSRLARGLTRAQARSDAHGKPSVGGALWSAGRVDALSSLMGHHQLSLDVILLSLLVAFWFGAGHALSPGHGKTIVAAYLVGSRGTASQAALLGVTVTVTHTAGVFALGLITLYLSRYVVPDQLYPWLGFISGLLVAGMGLTLFVRRWRALQAARVGDPSAAPERPHAQQPGHQHGRAPGRHHGDGHVHTHSHDHDHDPARPHRHGIFGRPHTHPAPNRPDGERVTARRLIGLGVSGGLLPCPSALVVLLSAIAFHQIALGMILIVAFSLGLATTLTTVGLLVVYGQRLLERILPDEGRGTGVRRLRPVLRAVPVFSALIVAALGALIAFSALNVSALPALLISL